jgi:hypothetical protein
MRVPDLEPPYILWSYRRREPSQVNILRACHAYRFWQKEGRFAPRTFWRLLIPWLVRFPVQLVRALRRFGPAARKTFGRPLALQVADIIKLSIANDLRPADYYEAGLTGLNGGEAMFRYVSERAYDQGARFCRDLFHGQPFDHRLAGDKLDVERRCRALGLPCTETIVAVAPDGTASGVYGPFDGTLPRRALFLKPANGWEGEDAERWDLEPQGYVSKALCEGPLSGADLLARAHRIARRRRSPALIQEVLRNNPRLAAVVGDTIATTRVVTIDDHDGGPRIVFTSMRMAMSADSPVDNHSKGGLACPVDRETGRVGPGHGPDYICRPQSIAVAPLTGAPLEELRLPHWPAVRALALALHGALRLNFIVGWDIAMTAEGPVLVEANLIPAFALVLQAFVGGYVGSDFGEGLTSHVRRGLDRVLPPDSRWRVGADI